MPFPDMYQAALANGMMVISDAAAFHQSRLLENPEDFGADVLQRLQNGAALPLKEYIQARRTQTLLRRQFARFFEKFDLSVDAHHAGGWRRRSKARMRWSWRAC